MPIIVKRPLAKADLADIWDYIADDSEARADSFIDRIDEKVNTLAQCPAIGRLRDELAENLRSFPVGRYVIFYLPLSDGIEIVRVLHSARDLNGDFFADE
ncbi:MAG: type II toxin-antitoxin system RelE/ParE family toxin [Methylococcales bacterium]|nr:type II toxin-antitoxin system RelE/ParE family toxin [Methylococcales bacterium]